MRLWRYCLAGLLYDWLAYVFWTVLPIRAEEFGATATQLALLQAASTVLYVLSCLLMGRLADRTHDLRMPYWLTAAAAAGAIVVQEAVYRRRSRS